MPILLQFKPRQSTRRLLTCRFWKPKTETPRMALNWATIKSIQDIMRKDAGVDGDAQRLGQLTWLFFLKIFDDREQEWEITFKKYRSPIPEELRWRNWAADTEGLTGDGLLDFINNKLFRTLKGLSPEASPRHRVIASSRHRVIESSSHRVIESSRHRVIESSSHRVIESSSHRVIESSSHRVIESSSHRRCAPGIHLCLLLRRVVS